MLRTVLVPLDGGAFGEQALPHAVAIARRAGATLHLVHVHRPALVPLSLDAPFSAPGYDIAADLERDREYLRTLVERLGAGLGVPVTSALVEGSVAEMLEERAAACGAELVVMSHHARTGLGELLHAGVAHRLSQSVRCPALLVRGDEPTDGAPATPREAAVGHVLVPLDGTPFAESMLEQAGAICRLFDAHCTLLHIVRAPVELGSGLLGASGQAGESIVERQRQAADDYLRRVAPRLRLPPERVHVRAIVSDDAGSAIVAIASERGLVDAPPVDLIAMQAHVHGRLSRLLGAHVSDYVLAYAPAPVLAHYIRHEPATPASWSPLGDE
jgi:nucleotide-binding universal stress UspA family protein